MKLLLVFFHLFRFFELVITYVVAHIGLPFVDHELQVASNILLQMPCQVLSPFFLAAIGNGTCNHCPWAVVINVTIQLFANKKNKGVISGFTKALVFFLL